VKIAAISHLASPDAPTGAEKSLAALTEALAGRGHELGVVAPGRWCLGSGLEASGVEVATIRSRSCWLVQWGPQPRATQLLRFLRYRLPDPGYRRMMVWLDRFWPDVVYVNCLPQLKGAAAARALGLPVVWHIREILPPGFRRRWFARRLKRDATRIVAVSHAVAEWLNDEGLGDLVTVVHNGCDVPRDRAASSVLRESFDLPAEGVFVGFFAQLVSHKGTVDMVQAGSLAMADVPSLFVVIAGAGPADEIERLRIEIAKSPFSERFFVLPPQREVWNLLAAVDIALVPSLWPDPLPRTVMEAMAAGRPVVAYRSGGVPEMIADGETGFMVEPGDREGLAERMVKLARDPELRSRLGTAAAARARAEFSVAAYVDAMEEILNQAAGG
jgi:glycosyltransferase involved in cell wall biosynthesis